LEAERHRQEAARLNALAVAAAKDAHENNFPSRRGTYPIEDQGLVCIYDNNPWANAPGLRAEHLEATRVALEEAGYVVVATGAYPASGKDAGYTRTLLVRAYMPSDCEAVRAIFMEQAQAMLDKLSHQDAPVGTWSPADG
jgi:hypothetical protein